MSANISGFYQDNPFPPCDPDNINGPSDLYDRIGDFYRLLERSIPAESDILVVGCGTGVLTNFLGLKGRDIVGVDLSSESLKTARSVRDKLDLEKVDYIEEDIRSLDSNRKFDCIIALGSLYNTSDEYNSFKAVADLVKDGGHMIYGTYNSYGRIPALIRKSFFTITGGRFKQIDPYLRNCESDAEREIVFNDQYRHPIGEPTRTVGEVKKWFSKNQIELLRCFPSLSEEANGVENILDYKESSGRFLRTISQLKWAFTGAGGYGFFIVIGRKGSQ